METLQSHRAHKRSPEWPELTAWGAPNNIQLGWGPCTVAGLIPLLGCPWSVAPAPLHGFSICPEAVAFEEVPQKRVHDSVTLVASSALSAAWDREESSEILAPHPLLSVHCSWRAAHGLGCRQTWPCLLYSTYFTAMSCSVAQRPMHDTAQVCSTRTPAWSDTDLPTQPLYGFMCQYYVHRAPSVASRGCNRTEILSFDTHSFLLTPGHSDPFFTAVTSATKGGIAPRECIPIFVKLSVIPYHCSSPSLQLIMKFKQGFLKWGFIAHSMDLQHAGSSSCFEQCTGI